MLINAFLCRSIVGRACGKYRIYTFKMESRNFIAEFLGVITTKTCYDAYAPTTC